MSHFEPSKYLEGMGAVVRRLMGAKENGWGTTYTSDEAVEQAVKAAYWSGRIDGVSWALGPSRAPGAVGHEEPLETLAEASVRLGLFPVPSEPPARPVVALEPLTGDPYAWAVNQARIVLGLSLVEADDYVLEVLAGD